MSSMGGPILIEDDSSDNEQPAATPSQPTLDEAAVNALMKIGLHCFAAESLLKVTNGDVVQAFNIATANGSHQKKKVETEQSKSDQKIKSEKAPPAFKLESDTSQQIDEQPDPEAPGAYMHAPIDAVAKAKGSGSRGPSSSVPRKAPVNISTPQPSKAFTGTKSSKSAGQGTIREFLTSGTAPRADASSGAASARTLPVGHLM